jgi:hypothetical protein
MQASIGIELVLYVQGYVIRGVPPEPDKHFGSRYKCNLDRWTLQSIALAIQKRGKYELKDAEIKAACVEVAKQVPRCPAAEPKKKKKTAEVFRVKKDAKIIIESLPQMLQEAWDAQECDGYTMERDVESLIEKVPPLLQEAWDMEGLTVGERQIRTKALMLQLCKAIMQRADANVETGSRRQRKRTTTEINTMAAEVVTGAMADYSPLAGYTCERTPEQKHATDCRLWREELSTRWCRHERGEAIVPMPKICGGFLTPDDAPTDELRADYEALLRAAGHWPLPTQPAPEEPLEVAALLDAQCEMLGEPDEQLAGGYVFGPLLKGRL